MKQFCLFFVVQFLYYGLLTWNYRSIAAGYVPSVFVSDLLCAAVSFSLIKRVAEARTRTAMAGYVLGGAVGSVVSIAATKAIYGK